MKVACCGEHTTHSSHPEFLPEYPGRLATLLGCDVGNFGFATAVVTQAVAGPAVAGGGKARLYQETQAAAQCIAFEPDILVLGPFGKHDALGPFSTHDTYDAEPLFSMDEFTAGLLQLVKWATDIAGARRVLLALPIPYPFGSTAHTISKVVLPATQEAAKKMSLQTIDLHTAFAGRREAFSDADHLQDADIDLMARTVAAAISSEPKL